jgi:hypothetical protein
MMSKYYRKPNMQHKWEFVRNAKLSAGCVRCGYNKHHSALEYHHIRGEKIRSIAASMTASWTNLINEINKCKVLCANCHNIEHYNTSIIGGG